MLGGCTVLGDGDSWMSAKKFYSSGYPTACETPFGSYDLLVGYLPADAAP
jgi:hypothetical protein